MSVPSPPDSPCTQRRRGRPPGRATAVIAAPLRPHHFSFLRAVLQGIGLREAWARYLAFEGGPDDERHFAARLRQIQARVTEAAERQGLQAHASLALGRPLPGCRPPRSLPALHRGATVSLSIKPLPSPAIPSLEEWMSERCRQWGVEADFQSQADWHRDYEAEFGGADLPVLPRPALSWDGTEDEKARPDAASGTLPDRLNALNRLASALAVPPALHDPLAAWLAPAIARHFLGTQVRAQPLAVVSVADLIAFVNLQGHRWWTCVPRLGCVRAARLIAWLQPVAQALGRPLSSTALQPQHRLALARQQAWAPVEAASQQRLGIVPLDRLAVPAELDGRKGVFRAGHPNTLGAATDLEAIFAWLRRHQDSPRTSASYSRIVERFYLWCLLLRRKPLSSLIEDDLHAYRAFLAAPPADWVQPRPVERHCDDWRPLRGPLGPSSLKLNLSVISALLSALIQAGYLTANAARGVMPALKLPALRINIDRSFDDAQWAWLLRCWRDRYEDCGPIFEAGTLQPLLPDDRHPDRAFARAASLRRTRLILELGATTGLRLIEFVTTRRSALSQERVDGRMVWILKVLGKGHKPREVLVHDDIKALLDQHHRDMARAATQFDPSNPRLRGLLNPAAARPLAPGGSHPLMLAGGASLVDSDFMDQLPLIGALRKPPPRWRADDRGEAFLDRDACTNTDRFGALDPTALYQALKRFLNACHAAALDTGPDFEPATLKAASTHWLRHFFANAAAADQVPPPALMHALGHASLQTTSVYLRSERRLMVQELSRMRRRS